MKEDDTIPAFFFFFFSCVCAYMLNGNISRSRKQKVLLRLQIREEKLVEAALLKKYIIH